MTGAALNGNDSDKLLINILNDLSATKFIPVNLNIAKRAASLAKRCGKQLCGHDAVHVATVIERKASYFMTNDKNYWI